jgi:hypothetical protein
MGRTHAQVGEGERASFTLPALSAGALTMSSKL